MENGAYIGIIRVAFGGERDTKLVSSIDYGLGYWNFSSHICGVNI